MSKGDWIPEERVVYIQKVYRTTDLDYDDIRERFNLSIREVRKICKDINKELPKVKPPKRRIEHDLYTPDELAIYRAFQSAEPDAFDSRRLDAFAVCNL
jgi:hypothetical protein